jgi:hypothetical protein
LLGPQRGCGVVLMLAAMGTSCTPSSQLSARVLRPAPYGNESRCPRVLEKGLTDLELHTMAHKHCPYLPVDRGRSFFRNFGKLIQDYTVSQSRRWTSSSQHCQNLKSNDAVCVYHGSWDANEHQTQNFHLLNDIDKTLPFCGPSVGWEADCRSS